MSLVQAGVFRSQVSDQLVSRCTENLGVEEWKVVLKHTQLQREQGQHTQQSSRLLDQTMQEVLAETQSHETWSAQLNGALTRCLLSLMQALESYRSSTYIAVLPAAA